MKTLKFPGILLILSLSLSLLTACGDDDDKGSQNPTDSIVEIAQSNPEFSLLVDALVKAELVTTLNGTGPFTVFAPTNAAFEALLSDLGVTGLDDLSKDDLTPILTYHVISGKVLSTQLAAGPATTLNGDFYLSLGSSVYINGATQVTSADLEATNGVVHVIDRVLVPPTEDVVDIAISNNPGEFNELVGAVVKAGLVDALKADGPFTLFAPTDAAFNELYTALGITGLDDLTANDLSPILLYHVFEARVFSTDLTSGAVNTLGGQDVTVNLGSSITLSDLGTADEAAVISTDILGTNGIVHIIDKVLLPE